MNAPAWIARLRPRAKSKATATPVGEPAAAARVPTGAHANAPAGAVAAGAAHTGSGRSTRERLKARLRKKEEALSPRVLRRTLLELQAVVDPRVSEVEGGRRARGVAGWYAGASPEERRDAWLLMSEQFAPDAARVRAAREQYEAAQGTADEGQAEIRLRRALLSPRTRLLQRFAVYPEGMRFLVDLRAELLPHLKSDKRLLALDAELESLFSTWFDVAFLELRRISWDSPASLIEKLIQYEAVHAIHGWADVKNRLDSDRRCYGFFHPRLPGEPLIFVEVALLDGITASIAPLLDEAAAPADLNRATTAIFYSISNTQAGLRGVSFGDSLIKRVVETLRAEFPRLKTFATLSPIPGLRAWLAGGVAGVLHALPEKERAELARACGGVVPEPAKLLALMDAAAQPPEKPLDKASDKPSGKAPGKLPKGEPPEKSPLRRLLLRCAAHYLTREWAEGKPADPVARFHLGNGARVQRLNWGGDTSAKGHRQSYGLMVNYVYDLRRLDQHRGMLAAGRVPASSEVRGLLG